MKKVICSILTTCTLLSSVYTTGNAQVKSEGAVEVNHSIQSPVSIPTLPKPTGSYQVGTVNFDWIDYSRKDLLTSEPKDYRELMVQVWYPIDSGKGKKKETYIPATEKGIDKMISSVGLGKQFAEINKINTQSYKNGLLSSKKTKYPIVLFSHGNSQSRWNYQTITRELASHGFIVVSIEHTHFALGTEFNNGRYIPNDYVPSLINLKKDDKDVNQLWVKDIQFVISQLEKLNKTDKTLHFKNRLDLNKMAAIGHSLGGAAAARALQIEPKIKSAMDIDGSLIGLSGKTGKMKKPFAFVKTEFHTKTLNGEIPPTPPEYDREQILKVFQQFSTRYRQAVSGPAYDITIAKASHMNFSDNPLLQRYLAGSPMDPHSEEIEPTHIYQLTNSVILAFLEESLNGKKHALLDLRSSYSDVEIVK
jgi:dienelactone hydrolase